MSDDTEYVVKDGRIVSPGRFQGEPEWIVTLWEMVQSGMADVSMHDGSMAIDAFEIDADIAKMTGYEPMPDTYVALWASDNGFVNHMVMTQAELDACEPCDLDSSDDDDYLDFVNEVPTFDTFSDFDDLGGESAEY